MDERIEKIIEKLKTEVPDENYDSLDDAPPQLFSDVAERSRMEAIEAKQLLGDWLSDRSLAIGDLNENVVQEACGAVRARIERILRDAEHPEAAAVLQCEQGGEPCLEITARRKSRLALMYGWSVDDRVAVRVPSEVFTSHIAMRARVNHDTAVWLWRSIYEAMKNRYSFQFLFRGLDLQIVGDRGVRIELQTVDSGSR